MNSHAVVPLHQSTQRSLSASGGTSAITRIGKHSAFTLIEVVIVMAILAVLAASMVPTLKGVQNERIAREPITELTRLAKEARLRAIKERRPYQVALSAQGFTATRYFDPYLSAAHLAEFLMASDQAETEAPSAEERATKQLEDEAAEREMLKADGSQADTLKKPQTTGPVDPASIPKVVEWTERYTLPEGTTYSVQWWHEQQPTPVAGELVKLWVFQPSGICEPLKISIQRESVVYDVEYSSLTVDIVKESETKL
jgi:prepilin-type N-terminal cleavage/methylation domain-containing protein